MKDWQSMLTVKDLEVLDLLRDGLGTELNPISEAAQNGNLQHIIDLGYSIKQLCRLATLAQMEILDYRQGPDEDGEPKALRRHWYSWWKTEFAQPYSQLLGQVGISVGLMGGCGLGCWGMAAMIKAGSN